jgi:hypothetical protein
MPAGPTEDAEETGVTADRVVLNGSGGSAPEPGERRGAVGPFLLGTAVGGVAGAVAGTLLSNQTRRLLIGMIHLAGRRLSDAEREELRFELLLQ